MAEWTFTNQPGVKMKGLISGTRYSGINTSYIHYGDTFLVRLDNKLGRFGFAYHEMVSKVHPHFHQTDPECIIRNLLTQREILFRKFEI